MMMMMMMMMIMIMMIIIIIIIIQTFVSRTVSAIKSKSEPPN